MISVSPVPAGPFGQDRRYVPADERVNGLVHHLRSWLPSSIHEFSTDVEERWTTRRAKRRFGRRERTKSELYPPIANISIRGRFEDVASVRSSE